MYKLITLGLLFVINALTPATALSSEPDSNAASSTVLIVSYDYKGYPIGRGTGFFVDKGVVITNIHVIDGAARHYRIYTADRDGTIDLRCYKQINRSDIKLNLENDVAYIRVFVDCPHGSVFFADADPGVGERVSVYGYPASNKLNLNHSSGHIIGQVPAGVPPGKIKGKWLLTSALMQPGNSGGPVVQDGLVVGIAVASRLNKEGKAVAGVFIPVSVIVEGLNYANKSSFGYTPQIRQKNTAYAKNPAVSPTKDYPINKFNPIPYSEGSPSNNQCKESLGEGAEATNYLRQQGNGCRCKRAYVYSRTQGKCIIRLEKGSRVVAPSDELVRNLFTLGRFTSLKVPPGVNKLKLGLAQRKTTPTKPQKVTRSAQKNGFKTRVCARVHKNYQGVLARANRRLKKRFGFEC